MNRRKFLGGTASAAGVPLLPGTAAAAEGDLAAQGAA
ncbi:hypothetical protein SALBM311S_00088 [Streptomyces alboniger]